MQCYHLPLEFQSELTAAPGDLLLQSVAVEEFETAAGPKLLQQEVLPQKPKCFEPKPGPGTEFQAALVKTAQTARAAAESGLRMPRAEAELPEGWERIAGLDTAGVAWRTRAAGRGKPSWGAPRPRCARRGRAGAAGAAGG